MAAEVLPITVPLHVAIKLKLNFKFGLEIQGNNITLFQSQLSPVF
jgi:hypothetical protein